MSDHKDLFVGFAALQPTDDQSSEAVANTRVSLLTAIAERNGSVEAKAPNLVDLRATEIHRAVEAFDTKPDRRRRHSFPYRIAAIATICITLVGFFSKTFRISPSMAFGDVAQSVSKTKTLRAVVEGEHETGTLYVSGVRTRFENRSNIEITDPATRERVHLDLNQRSAYRLPPTFGAQSVNVYRVIRQLADGVTESIDDFIDESQTHFPGYQGKVAFMVAVDKPFDVDAKVWFDPKTKLPVKIEVRACDSDDKKNNVFRLNKIEFDVALQEKLFDTAIPDGFTVVGMRVEELRPVLTKEDEIKKLTIIPGVGIGKVRFGATREQVVAEYGEPEFTMYDTDLCYPSIGLQLILNGPGKTLGLIIANPFDAANLVRNEFPGQTVEGIRIGSSHKHVRDVYGKPDRGNAFQIQGPARYGYHSEGLQFGFMKGEVCQIITAPK